MLGRSINWQRSGWGAALQKVIWGCWFTAGLMGVSSVPGSWEAKPHPGMHQTQHNQPVKRQDHLSVFSIAEASP